MARWHGAALVILLTFPIWLDGQQPTQPRPWTTGLGDVFRTVAEDAYQKGRQFEQQKNWMAALDQYRKAAEYLKTNESSADLLLASSAYLDAARMLAQMSQEKSAAFNASVQKAQETANKALAPPIAPRSSFFSTPERAAAYNNLGLANAMSGNLGAARNAFSNATVADPKFAPAIKGLQWTKAVAAPPPQKKPSGMTDEQWHKARDYAIGLGVLFFTKEYPIGAPVIGMTLKLMNDLSADSGKKK